MSKNIETCKSEEVLSSVLDQQPQDYPSVQQAVRDLDVTALPAASAADPDIDELPANVEVFVRRVLKAVVYDRVLPVVQQMWQAVMNRISSPNYLPDTLRPYASNPSLRTLGTLPTALSALSSRKISNGGATNDGIKDGVSLAMLLCSTDRDAVTKLVDDNSGWVCDNAIPANIFPNLGDATLRMGSITAANALNNLGATGKVTMPELTTITSGASQYNDPMPLNATEIIADEVTASDAIFSQKSYPNLQKVSMKKVRILNGRSFYDLQAEGPLKELYLPELRTYDTWAFLLDYSGTRDKYLSLILLEIGSDVSCNLANWNPTNALSSSASDLVADPVAHPTWKNLDQFLQNFLHHIAERLAVGPTTNRLTLTLSADVYSACGFGATIDDPTDIRYQIKKAIQDRNWKVTDGTNNFNQ